MPAPRNPTLRRRRLFQYRPFAILVGVLVSWLLVPYVFKALFKKAFYEFQAPVSVAASFARQAQDYWATKSKTKKELYETGADLARLNANYEIAILRNQTLKEEIARLERLLQLPSRPDFKYEIARVVERDFNSWWQQIEVRKGKNFNIPVGAPVIFSGGVVGRVREVNEYTSVVDLISNDHTRLAVIIEGDNRPLSFRGAGARLFGSPIGIAEYVPLDAAIKDRSNLPRLITSGMGGVFPPGLHVGRLATLRQGSSGMFLEGDVRLDKRLTSLTEVAILVPIAPEES